MGQKVAQGEGLTSRQKEFLAVVLQTPYILKKFYLSGGTALSSWYLHHRESFDLDFFSEKEEVNSDHLIKWLASQKEKLEIIDIAHEQQFGFNFFNISEKELSLMKPTAILINLDQAQQVDTEALYKALKENKIGGAGLDQVANLTKDHPILKLDNVVFLAHSGSYTNESFRENLPELVVLAVEGFVKGSPKNLVNT